MYNIKEVDFLLWRHLAANFFVIRFLWHRLYEKMLYDVFYFFLQYCNGGDLADYLNGKFKLWIYVSMNAI